MKKKEVYEIVLNMAKDIARKKEGALFVIAPIHKFSRLFDPLYPQLLTKHHLNEAGISKVVEKLATLDGAVLISDNGEILAYGAKIKKSKAVHGFGTRHAAAAGITEYLQSATAVLISEELNWIRVFQNGRIVLETDAEANPRSMEQKIVSFLTDGDTALLTAAGVSAAILGSVAVAPVMIIGGTYLAIKTAAGVIKRNWLAKGRETHSQHKSER